MSTRSEATYQVAPRGLATSFVESETPIEYCQALDNRIINQAGGAEKRQGIAQLGATVSGVAITGMHEYVEKDGTTQLFVTGSGAVWRQDSTVSGPGIVVGTSDSDTSSSAGSTWNATVDIGTAATDRIVVARLTTHTTATHAHASVTINGVVATMAREAAADASGQFVRQSVWWALVPTTTGDVTVAVTFTSAASQTTSGRFAGTGATINSGAGAAWTNPGNITASDGSDALSSTSNSVQTDTLRGTNFGFSASDVPSGSTILGVEFGVERSAQTGGTGVFDHSIRFVKQGVISGSELKNTTQWPGSDTEVFYGGLTNLLGTTITQADVIASTTGLDIQAVKSGGTSSDCGVDAVRMRVAYTPPLYAIIETTAFTGGLTASPVGDSNIFEASISGPAINLSISPSQTSSLVIYGAAAYNAAGTTTYGTPSSYTEVADTGPGANITAAAGHRLLTDAAAQSLAAPASASSSQRVGIAVEFRAGGLAWTKVHSAANGAGHVLQTVQMGDRLIFVNGTSRNFYTTDGSAFRELVALIEQGQTASASTSVLDDADIADWTVTEVNVNDLAHNITQGGYGLITAVTVTAVTHTNIGSAATGLGQTATNQGNGDRYEIIDLVEMNIIPTDDPNAPDNVATGAVGTNATTVAVSGVNFATTDIRAGDYVYNSTRAAVAQVSAIATALTVTSVASQTNGDSLVFLKSAMPIAEFAHVHFNRLYLLDARDLRKVRISGANDPQDFSTDGATLDPITFNFDLESRGDHLRAIGSFQRFLVLAGRRAIYVYQGTTPIGADADLTIVGSFPIGLVSRYGLLDIGNDLVFLSDDGLQSLRIIVDANAVQRANLADPVRTTMRDLIKMTAEIDLRLVHYARRSLVFCKLGTEIYVFNYAASLIDKENPVGGSWSRFTGPLAQQQVYLPLSSGDLICGGLDGRVFEFDQGLYTDDGQAIPTSYKTGWLTLERPRGSTVRLKEVKSLKMLFEMGDPITVNVTLEGGFEGTGNDTGTMDTLSVRTTDNVKIPLRGRGEVVRLTVTTTASAGPDILGRYTAYFNTLGRR